MTGHLFDAVASGDRRRLRRLLKTKPSLGSRSPDGLDVVSFAIDRGHGHLVKPLLRAGASPDGALGGDYTPLQCALEQPDVKAFRLLLSRGADANRKGAKEAGCPIHLLAAGYLDVALFRAALKAGADVNTLDDHGNPPLYYALAGMHDGGRDNPASAKVVRFLLGAGANPDLGLVQGRSLRQWFCERHREDSVDPAIGVVLELLGCGPAAGRPSGRRSFESEILSYCERHGVAVPAGFRRRPPKRWAVIRRDASSPRLVALTFAAKDDVRIYLARQLDNDGVDPDRITILDGANGEERDPSTFL